MTSNDLETGQSALSIRPAHPQGVTLREIAERVDVEFESSPSDETLDTRVTGTTLNSKDVRQGDLYFALPGARRHGAEFAGQAADHGAVAVMTDAAGALVIAEAGIKLPVLVSAVHPRHLAGAVSGCVYGTTDLGARVFGITGTNGKTSIIYLLDALMRAAGMKTGLSSTAERRVGDTVISSSLTSPEAPELHGLLARMVEEDVTGIAIEVSAHATARHRIDGVEFDVVGFNNFSRDHLDDFGDMEQYFAAKLSLFSPAHAKQGVVVVDGPYGQRIARESRIPVTTLATEYGVSADWHLAITRQDLDGVSFVLQGPEGAHFRGSVPVFGRFMAENAAVALIMLHQSGVTLDQVSAGLQRGQIPVYIPGRLEAMNPGAPLDRAPRFYVDYGHTPGSFEATLAALGEVAPGRVIFMFGADGDRDTEKRGEMGRIAAAGSDIVIICDYHPRSEDPAVIRAQLIEGAQSAHHAEVFEVPDAREAIARAISLARPGDVILYAGPGHEDFQEIAGTQLAYSARDEVRGALREAGLLE